MFEYRHYKPTIEFDIISGRGVEEASMAWGEYVVQSHESLFEKIIDIKLIDVGPCPDEDGCCEECSG